MALSAKDLRDCSVFAAGFLVGSVVGVFLGILLVNFTFYLIMTWEG